jgi:hypothetical protein
MIDPVRYLPQVAWGAIAKDVIQLTEETELIPATYQITADPLDINEEGAATSDVAINYYIKDFVGHTFKIKSIGPIVVEDSFRCGSGPQTDRHCVVYKSVGRGRSPFLAPIYYTYLDDSAVGYSQSIELEVLFKRLYEEVCSDDIVKWLANNFGENVEFGQALGMGHTIGADQSTAIGVGAITTAFRELVMGSYPSQDALANATGWVDTDRLVTIGNSAVSLARSNALVIFKSGLLKLYNAVKIGKFVHGVVVPEVGTLQFDANKLQVWIDGAWKVMLSDAPSDHKPYGRNDADWVEVASKDSVDAILASEGAANGIATLGSDGKVPATQLPSYVDDVLEFADFASLPGAGSSGIIYVTRDTNITYRWSGTAYVEISASLALGETSGTAYRGDRGKTAYDHSQITTGQNPHNTTFANIASKPTTISGFGITDIGNTDTNFVTIFETELAI